MTDVGVKRPMKKSARRLSRELALQGIYEWLAKGTQEEIVVIDAHIQDQAEFAKADAEHYRAILYGAIKESAELRETFIPLLDRAIDELSPVEHAILLIAGFELRHSLDIPYKVVINEGVELAKAFGGTDGFKFVNGILDKLALQWRELEVTASKRR